MERHVSRDLAGRCGMYCGVCEIHRAYTDGGKFRIEVARKHNCLPGDVRCKGCRGVAVVGWAKSEDWGKNCAILRCLKSRQLATCGECPTISSCERWQALAEELFTRGIDLKANLQEMSRLGPDAWVKEQDKRWRCQHCHEPVAVTTGDSRCQLCGEFNL